MSLLSSQPIYQGRIISLALDTVRFPDGSTGLSRKGEKVWREYKTGRTISFEAAFGS